MSATQSMPSAVVVPDADEIAPALPSAKRRHSSLSEESSKRLRLSASGSAASPPPRAAAERPPPQPLGKNAEERKRGKRLFGVLLGALGQDSSAAQKRRGDIERRQREKLQRLDEEHGEQRKKNREALLQSRAREQKLFDRQSVVIRHDNMLATAHFLHTRAEPRLYYKPWEIRPEEQARIDKQVDDAKAKIARELEAREAAPEADQDPESTRDAPPANGEFVTTAGDGDAGDEKPRSAAGGQPVADSQHELAMESDAKTDGGGDGDGMDDPAGYLVKGDEDDVMY